MRHYVVWYHFDGGMTNAFRCQARDGRQARKLLYDYWGFFGGYKRSEIIITGVDRED